MEPHKLAEITSRTDEFIAFDSAKPFGRGASYFCDWATVEAMLEALGLTRTSLILDIGCGPGWTSLFLSEAGYEVVGYDLVPANVALCQRRAARWGSSARFELADMEDLPGGPPADAALIFDALHHSGRQLKVLRDVAGRLRPGGWVILGEPSWLHRYSPGARRTQLELGWMERGIGVRELRRDLRASGFDEIRRFFQPTLPYEGRSRAFAWQLLRLISANVLAAPQAHIWLAARRAA